MRSLIILVTILLITSKAHAQNTVNSLKSDTVWIISDCATLSGVGRTYHPVVPELPYFLFGRFGFEHSDYVLDRTKLVTLPQMKINDLVSLVPGCYQRQQGSGVNIFGSRDDGNLYVVDNIQLMR